MESILIVEDDADIGQLLARALSLEGYETTLTGNGKDALSALSERLPSLILLDYHLPGMSWNDFRRAHQAHPEYQRVPVVLMSAESGLEDKFEPEKFLQKPIELDSLLQVVRSNIAR